MNIEVIGPGCRFCKKLYALVEEVLAEKEIEAQVSHVTDFMQVIKHIPFTPVLIVNGTIVHRGKILPSKEKLATLLAEN